MVIFTLFICLIMSLLLTPYIKKIAIKIGATDKPSERKVHQKIMPRLGGLAIFISFLIGSFVIDPGSSYHMSIILAAFVIILLGVFDDIYELSAKVKIVWQAVAALIVIVYGGLQMEFINLPFGGVIEFGIFSVPITLFWILAITNAINLIDGLDGLAAGVSSIALVTIAGMAAIMGNIYVLLMALLLLSSTLGFLYHNFYPAKIFLGDTGALFLGFMISVLSLLGFKNITLVSLVIPILILGVPVSDTIFAIIRRKINKTPFYLPDRSHLHHKILDFGFSHRQTVIIIYGISAIFGLVAFLFSMATIWWSIIIVLALLLAIELLVEFLGLVDHNYKPILNFLKVRRVNEPPIVEKRKYNG